MENIRVILAVVALGIGALLVVIAFIRSLRKKAPATANWVFSGLFLVVGLVLWIRGSDPALSDFPATTEVTQKKPQTETSDSQIRIENGEKKKSVPSDAKIVEQESNKITTQERLAAVEEASPISQHTELQSRQTPEYRSNLRQISPQPRTRTQDLPSWEDKIFAAIDASFDWIEEFFEEYATPVAASKPKTKQPKKIEQPEIVFPEIRFNDGTAELTSESQVELKILATRLTTEYPKGVLEIQAYVDSVGPEAFNFVLTQARADAVRDMLIAEGISESRIIAKGYGTGEDPEFADSRVEFIVRN